MSKRSSSGFGSEKAWTKLQNESRAVNKYTGLTSLGTAWAKRNLKVNKNTVRYVRNRFEEKMLLKEQQKPKKPKRRKRVVSGTPTPKTNTENTTNKVEEVKEDNIYVDVVFQSGGYISHPYTYKISEFCKKYRVPENVRLLMKNPYVSPAGQNATVEQADESGFNHKKQIWILNTYSEFIDRYDIHKNM